MFIYVSHLCEIDCACLWDRKSPPTSRFGAGPIFFMIIQESLEIQSQLRGGAHVHLVARSATRYEKSQRNSRPKNTSLRNGPPRPGRGSCAGRAAPPCPGIRRAHWCMREGAVCRLQLLALPLRLGGTAGAPLTFTDRATFLVVPGG